MLNTGLVSVGIWQLFDFWEDLNDSDGQWSEGCQGVRPALTLILGKQSARASRLGVFSSLTKGSQSVWQPAVDCINQNTVCLFIIVMFFLKSTCNKKFYSGFEIINFEYNAVWLWESGKGGCLIHLLRWLTAETRMVIIFLAPVTFLVMDTRHGESGLMETLIHVPPISLSPVVNAALISSIHSNVLSCDFYFFCISRPWLVVRRSMFLCCFFAELGLF